jgi:hypothetical protein
VTILLFGFVSKSARPSPHSQKVIGSEGFWNLSICGWNGDDSTVIIKYKREYLTVSNNGVSLKPDSEKILE